ncbi:hypothetical protein CBOM_04313 [Ceraceosorus bombacis]|uniref:Uncharacterized protein n=1 Tax=Ceraceosorus bombacis TaxID=401625 RepID=A0A0P1BPH3_9BASI|nr:hypothetical protein CBOM_04313 [Ceraceosorus bombacis]
MFAANDEEMIHQKVVEAGLKGKGRSRTFCVAGEDRNKHATQRRPFTHFGHGRLVTAV